MTEELPQDWIFTFGCGHDNAGRYVSIYGTYNDARKEMHRRYGMKWCMQYSSKEDAGVEVWGYEEIK